MKHADPLLCLLNMLTPTMSIKHADPYYVYVY